MTSKEIEELAGHRPVSAWIVKLVNDAIAIEREACAKVCEVGTGEPIQMKALEMLRQERERIAKAIRARGQE